MTMTRLSALVLLVLSAAFSAAQSGTTAVTATVHDSSGNLYVNCQWSAVFVGENTTPGAGPYAPASYLNGQQGTCTSIATFSVNLADNVNTITPTPSQWNFSICSATGYVAGPYCRSNILITITGTTQDITSILTPLMPILPPSGNGVPIVFNGNPTGSCVQTQTAVDSTTGNYYSCSGGTWVKVGPGTGGGGGGVPGGSAFQIQTNVGGVNFGGISNVAKGSALVSAGASAFPVMQTKPVYDVRDWGFVGDGTTDNSPAALSLLSAIGSSNATVQMTLAHVGMNNFVWPANLTLDFTPGGTLKPLTDSTTTPGTATLDSTAGATAQCQSNGTSTTCAMAVTAVANDTYAIVCARGYSGGQPVLTSSVASDIIVPLLTSNPGYSSNVTSFMVPNVTAGARTFTATSAGNLVGACSAIPISGLGPTPSLDGAGYIGSNVSNSTTMTGTATFQSGSFLLSFGGNNSTAETCTQTGTFTLVPGIEGCSTNTGSSLAVAYLASAASGPNTGSIIISAPPSNYWSFIVLGLRPGSATEYIRGGINNPSKAQIFENATGTGGKISFDYNLVNFDVYPEWWGAGGSASATTNTAAIQAAEHGAFGTGRVNGGGFQQYNKPLVLDANFQINGEIQFYDVTNFKVNCDRRLSGGITQTSSSNLRIIDGQSVAYGSFNDCAWSGSAANTNALIDLDYNGVTTPGDLAPQFVDFVRNLFNGNNLVATGMLLAKSGGGSQGSNIYCWNCEGESFTNAVWQIGTPTSLATNAIDIGWYGGDMEGNPQYGIACWACQDMFVHNTTFENGFATQTGFDVYGANTIGGSPQCIIDNSRSESRRLASCGNGYIRNSFTIDQSAYPTPGTSDPVGTIIKGSVVGGDGAYYKVTVDSSAFSGAGSPTALLNASGGSSTTLADTNDTVAGAVTNGGGGALGYFSIGETVTQAVTGSTATLINRPTSVGQFTGSVTSGVFVASEIATQATTGATCQLDGTPTGSQNMFCNYIVGTPDNSHIWTGGTSGATYTPTGTPTFAASNPPMLITLPTGSPDSSHTWTGGTSGAVYTPSGAPTAQVNWTSNAFNGMRVSVMGGTGLGCYGVVTANTATQITFSAGFVSVYNGLPCTTPDTTSTFLVEPGWNGGTVVSGGITMVALNEKAIDSSNGSVGMQGTLENVTIPGDQVSVNSNANVKNLRVTRPDWLPSAGGGWWQPAVDHDWDVHLTQSVTSPATSPGGANTYYRNWQFPNSALGTILNRPFQRNLGTVPLVWSCGFNGGLANVCSDVWIGGRSDPFSTNNASRTILEFGGYLGRSTPVGTNQAGLSTDIQGGLPTGSGTQGNINFRVAPGTGSSGTAVQTSTLVASVDPNGFEGAIGGTTPSTGSFCGINGVAYVGGTCASYWGGGDIGAQINAAYAALPSSGGSIYIAPAASCYNFSTPIVLATSGKYVILNGLAAGSSNNANPGGACLNYTPVTATDAITVDWTPLAGGGIKSGSGISHITLVNNGCNTAGGCGSSAKGIHFATTNGGAENGLFQGLTVQGFGTGLYDANAASISYGMNFVNLSVAYNTTGINLIGYESLHFFNLYAQSNGTGVSIASGETDLFGGGIESNQTANLIYTGAVGLGKFNVYGMHFENLGNTTANYISGNMSLTINGGSMLDDYTAGPLLNWLIQVGGNHVKIDGLQISTIRTAGITSILNAIGTTRGITNFLINSPLLITNRVNGVSANFISDMSTQPNTANPYVWNLEGPVGIGGTNGGLNAPTILSSLNTGAVSNTLSLPATSGTVALAIASGTASLGTASIASAACAAVVTVAATGVLTTDTLTASFNSDVTGVTGYIPSTAGNLMIYSYPTANNVNFKVCNPTANPIVPGTVVLNWRVGR